jgi:hypothetical protein
VSSHLLSSPHSPHSPRLPLSLPRACVVGRDGTWRRALILNSVMDGMLIRVHYIGFAKSYDDDLDTVTDSHRVRVYNVTKDDQEAADADYAKYYVQ